MKIPLYYIAKNFVARKLTTSITVLGVALVVFVFVAVLMMAFGIYETMKGTGSDDNVIITRKSSSGEITSIIDRETANTIFTLPLISKSSDGKPFATTDGVVVINLTKKGGGMSNVTVRGVNAKAFELRPQVKLAEGRMFNFGSREIVAARGIQSKFDGANIGDKIKFAGDYWTIVGVMEAEQSAFNSELWGDVDQLQQAFNRTQFSTITCRLTNPSELEALKMKFAGDPRLNQYEPERETTYYSNQSKAMVYFIVGLGVVVTVIFAAGAIIGAMITMYAAVANRTAEIGTLRALGFQKLSIQGAFLLESLLLSTVGGAVGIFLASFLQFVSISTLNFGSFSELAFSFTLSGWFVFAGLGFAILMGFVGGFLPSFQASRLDIINALRGGS